MLVIRVAIIIIVIVIARLIILLMYQYHTIWFTGLRLRVEGFTAWGLGLFGL